jgi:hypothetical protein
MDELPAGVTDVVLIDDVYTKGGHVKACEATLRLNLGARVELAICLGRTVEKPMGPVFGKRVMHAERFLDLKSEDQFSRCAKGVLNDVPNAANVPTDMPHLPNCENRV